MIVSVKYLCRGLVKNWSVCLALSFLTITQLYASQTREKSNILILHSYHIGYQWTDNIQSGLNEALGTNNNIGIFVEYMDLMRNPGHEYVRALEGLYDHKYTRQNIEFDVIIAADDGAFNFVTDNHKSLFFNAPVIFVGVNELEQEIIDGAGDITGIYSRASTRETVELAIRLTGDPGRLAVVSGSRPTEKLFVEHFIEEAYAFEGEIDIVYLTELEPRELSDSLKQLNPDDIVLYLSYLLTPSGMRFSVKESIELIRSSTDAPVFCIWYFPLPYGAVGGKIIHGFYYGEAAANIALRIVEGEKAGDIPIIEEGPNRFMFNGGALFDHNIPEKMLPDHSVIINRRPEYLLENWHDIIEDSFFTYDLFENHGNVMLLVEPGTGMILDANRAAFNYYGYADLTGKNIYDINILPQEDIEREMEKVRSIDKNYFTFKHILADGDIRDVEVFSYPVEVNNTVVLFSIIIDISDRVAAEEKVRNQNRIILGGSFIALIILTILIVLLNKNLRLVKKRKDELQESEQKFRSYIENAPVSIFVTDKDGNFLQVNPAACDLSGYSEKELLSSTIESIIPPGLKERSRSLYYKILKTGKVNDELSFTNTSNEKRYLTIEAVKLENDQCMTFATDSTGRKEMEQALKTTNKNLEEMIYIASHDLQAPLISLESYAIELLENYKDKLDEEGRYCLERLKSNSQRMHKLVLGLLDISRLNTAEMTPEKFPLKPVVENVISDLSLAVEKKNAKIIIGDLPSLYADRQRFETVIRNLVANALNYGGKNIKISFEKNILSVKDDGIGIPGDQLERVFRPGERIKTVKVEGIGMGLTFCKKVIEQHNGKIWAESDGVNKGATIHILLNPANVIK